MSRKQNNPEVEPPQNLEAEVAILGSVFLDPMAIHRVSPKIAPTDFFHAKHGNIYQSMLNTASKGQNTGILEVSADLESRGLLEKVGGRSSLVEISNSVITSAHIETYVELVLDKSLRRQLFFAQSQNERTISQEDRDINSVIADVQANIFKVSPIKKHTDRVQDILVDLTALQKEYAEKYKDGKRYIGVPCGFEKIDDKIDGLRPGHLWVIGAWHGTGKTSFALNIIHHILEQNVPCSIISLEMSQVDILAKIMGIRHKMTAQKIIKGKHEFEERNNVDEAKHFLSSSNFEIHTEFDLEKIKMQIRRDVYVNHVKVVLIDYLQKITSEKIMEETPLMSKAAKDFSNLAQELKITIIALSQISNETQKGQGAGAGFKGSGAIEASADMAIRLKRDRAVEEAFAESVPVQVMITKNKFGMDGSTEGLMHLPSGSFLIP